jgi:outer membrane protein, multidrug efflux system
MTDTTLRRGATFAALIVLIIVVVIAAALAGCAVGPDYHQPATPVAAQFAAAADAPYSGGAAGAEFWTEFGDPELNTLVADALSANHDLRIALAHLHEARALRRQTQFDLAPTITADGGYTKERFAQVDSPTGVAYTTDYYSAGFDAFWELDFFGRVRRSVQAQDAQVGAAEAGLHDAQVSVTAEVARNYFELRGAQLQLSVAQRNVDNQRETLKLTEAQLSAGRSTELDTARAQAQLSTTLATIGPLEATAARAIHRLAVLTGREPNALTPQLQRPADLPPLPELTAVGAPAELLRRRPDIRVAERQLAASTALVGVAIGDLFPQVTFTGSFNYSAAQLGALGDSASRGFVIGPAISWPAFDLGRVQAQVQGSRARADVALAQYEQTVLRALEETEDALVTHARTRDSLQQARAAAEASRIAARIARKRYEEGIVDFLEVLDAERTQLAAEDRLAQSQTDAATSLIAVYKALGGAWQSAPPPRYVRQAGG